MTKEELVKEAEYYFKSICEDYNEEYERTGKRHYFVGLDIKNGYLASAEPREKRIEELIALINAERERQEKCDDVHLRKIAELEKENAELKEELKTAYRKGMRHMAKALKDYDRTDGAWTDYFEHTVDKVLQKEQLEFEEYGTLADQLTKAKELLKEWLQTSKASGCDNINIVTDTEQFLKESE